MKIYRLNAEIRGTKRSIGLDEDEVFQMTLPTWMPNEAQNLYTVNDYISNMVLDAPSRNGDWITKLILESTEVPEDIDFTSSNNIKLYGGDENEQVKWTFEVNLLVATIKNIIEKENIFQSDTYELAAAIVNGRSIFGWSNVDPGDLVPEIAAELSAMRFGR